MAPHKRTAPSPPPGGGRAGSHASGKGGGRSTRTCLRPQESWSCDWRSFLNSSRVLAFASLGLANAPLPRPASAAALRSRSAAVKVFSPNPRPIPPPVPRPRQPHVRPRERQHHSRRRRRQAEPRSSRPRRRGRRAHWAVAAARPSAEELAGYLGVMCWAVGSNVEPHDAAYCNAHPCESECGGGEAGVGGGEAGAASLQPSTSAVGHVTRRGDAGDGKEDPRLAAAALAAAGGDPEAAATVAAAAAGWRAGSAGAAAGGGGGSRCRCGASRSSQARRHSPPTRWRRSWRGAGRQHRPRRWSPWSGRSNWAPASRW